MSRRPSPSLPRWRRCRPSEDPRTMSLDATVGRVPDPFLPLPQLTAGAARTEAERCLYCYDAPCAHACPTGIDVAVVHPQDRDGQSRGQREDDPRRQPARSHVRRRMPRRAPVRGRLRPQRHGPANRDRAPPALRRRNACRRRWCLLHPRRRGGRQRGDHRRRARGPRVCRRAAPGGRRRHGVRRERAGRGPGRPRDRALAPAPGDGRPRDGTGGTGRGTARAGLGGRA